MEILFYVINTVLQVLVVIIVAPLPGGIVKKIKAFSQKREGPPVFQLYYDIYKLLSKERVVSQTTSWIFRVSPFIILASTLSVFLFIPVIPDIDTFSIAGDVILIIYLLALGKFFLTLSALDAGSTFGGMGSSRESMISSLTEPGFLLSLFTLSLLARSTSLTDIMSYSENIGIKIVSPTYLLIFIAMILILISETSRIPIDDPSTHLELTMVHEAMLLENSGSSLAMLELSAAVKQLIILTIIANVFIPFYGIKVGYGVTGFFIATLLSLLIYTAKVVFISVIVSFAEIFTVKLRLFSTSGFAALSFILAFIAFLQTFILGGV